MGFKVKLPMTLKMDNKGAVDLANNWSIGGCTRHVDARQCFLRELKESKVMDIWWIKCSENNADSFTKNLDGPTFEKCIRTLVGPDLHMKKSSTSEQEGVGRYPKVLRRVSRNLNNEGLQNANLFYVFE